MGLRTLQAKRIFVVACSVFFVFAANSRCTAEGGAITETQSPIVNGVITGDYPAVGALLFDAGGSASNANGICSGTLVGCQTFLTAAHCVCDTVGGNCQPGDLGAPNPNLYFVYVPHFGVVPVQSIAVQADYDFPVGDVAVLRLASPVSNVRPARINTSAPPATGMAGTIVGFGLTAGGNNDYGVKRSGSVTTVGCTGGISSTTSVCWAFRSPLGSPGSNSNTCNGDSGGPLFLDLGSGPVVAGITSGGNSQNCLPPDDSYDANVYAYRSWIAAQAGADLNNVSCGAGPQVGDPEVTVLAYAGAAASGEQVVYDLEVPPATSEIRLALNATRDFDLYVRQAPGVSRTTFDCKHDGPSQVAVCAVTDPPVGAWSALVDAYGGSGAYQLTITLIGKLCSGSPDGTPCDDANDCTENDQCQAGACVGSPRPDGSPCSDGNRCTNPDTCMNGACVGGNGPRPGCKQMTLPGAGTFRVARPSLQPPSLTWRWRAGQSTDRGQFGDPRAATDYDVCLYEHQSGQDILSWQKNISPGGVCYRGRACWTDTRSGFRFANRTGGLNGITRLQLVSGPDGQAQFTLKAGTPALQPPTLPLSPRVTVQLVNDLTCWEARFSTPSVNTANEFRARSDP